LLQKLRRAAGLSEDELAERAGLSRRGISDLERGQRRSPHLSTVRRLADALGLAALVGPPRVLPMPPAPVSVSRRVVSNSPRISASSRSRPTKLVSGWASGAWNVIWAARTADRDRAWASSLARSLASREAARGHGLRSVRLYCDAADLLRPRKGQEPVKASRGAAFLREHPSAHWAAPSSQPSWNAEMELQPAFTTTSSRPSLGLRLRRQHRWWRRPGPRQSSRDLLPNAPASGRSRRARARGIRNKATRDVPTSWHPQSEPLRPAPAGALARCGGHVSNRTPTAPQR